MSRRSNGTEEEQPVPLERPAERGAELLLAERRLVAVDARRRPGRTSSKWLLALRLSSRKKKNALPAKRLVPLLVTMLTTPPEALPNSAEYEFVSTWNSCTASWLNTARTDADRRIVVVEPVDGDVVRAGALAGERQSGGRRGALLRRAIGGHGRRDHRERDEVAAVDRQVLDLLRDRRRWRRRSARCRRPATAPRLSLLPPWRRRRA